MQKFFEHKIADKRMVRLLMKWLLYRPALLTLGRPAQAS
jgi:hypothetical protein